MLGEALKSQKKKKKSPQETKHKILSQIEHNDMTQNVSN